MTKRVGHRFEEVCDLDNISRAGLKAAKDKGNQKDVQYYLENRDRLNRDLRSMLIEGRYDVTRGDYNVFIKHTQSGKDREIHKLPFYPFRVCQHAILNVMLGKWVSSLNEDVYNCLPDHGINSKVLRHSFSHKLKRALLDSYSVYALQSDIQKFYPSVDNKLFGRAYRHDLKDKKLINLLDKHNFSNDGLPIGSPDAQINSHLVLRKFDRFVKEELKVRYYFRYADDTLILSDSKQELHQIKWRIKNYLYYELGLTLKSNARIFPVRLGADICGYVFRPGYTLLRKRTKKAIAKRRNKQKSIASYKGIMMHCNSKNFIQRVIEEDNRHMKITDLDIQIERPFDGTPIKIDKIVDEEIDILDFDVRESTKKAGHLWVMMQVRYQGKKCFIKGGYDYIASYLKKLDEHFISTPGELNPKELAELKTRFLPLEGVVIKQNRGYYIEGTLKNN